MARRVLGRPPNLLPSSDPLAGTFREGPGQGDAPSSDSLRTVPCAGQSLLHLDPAPTISYVELEPGFFTSRPLQSEDGKPKPPVGRG